jgi:hypothetical protein
VSIFEFKDLQPKWKDRGAIPNIRLTCRRFCALSSHLLIRKVYVDITQPETVDRLQRIAANASLAKGVREVYLRVHFYNPWVAASFENFAASVESEWGQRCVSRSYSEQYHQERTVWEFDQIAWNFIRRLDRTVADDASHHGLEEQSTNNDADTLNPYQIRPRSVLQRAYDLYKTGYESQCRIMQNGGFISVITQSLLKFKDLRSLTIYDHDLNNNYDPGSTIRIPTDDHVGQEAALVSVFSRPMVWEDAQWIEPTEEIWKGVPVELLVEIPIAIGETKGILVDYLHIKVTAAPDYARLPTDPATLNSLTTALKSMGLFQFCFNPCGASGCGPWWVSDGDGRVRRAEGNRKSAAELQAFDNYIGAILDCDSIEHADINLGDFWYGAGFDSIRNVPTCLGSSWFRNSASAPASSGIKSLQLTQLPLTMRDLEIFIKALDDDEEVEIQLIEVYLCNGTWKQFLDALRMAERKNIQISFTYPLGGGLDSMDQEVYSSVFSRFDPDRGSLAEQFIRGKIDRNPLE